MRNVDSFVPARPANFLRPITEFKSCAGIDDYGYATGGLPAENGEAAIFEELNLKADHSSITDLLLLAA